MVIGMSMISQSFVQPLERATLYLLMLTCRKDRKLNHIISKNLKAHRTRNMKTALMFTMTICFLMYSSTSFAELEYMIMSLTGAVIGADLSIIRSNAMSGVPVSLDERVLSQFFEENKYNQTIT